MIETESALMVLPSNRYIVSNATSEIHQQYWDEVLLSLRKYSS